MTAATRPLVIAHRGASAQRPENTAAAYRLAIEQQADMIEIDLHRTRDGVIVVAHDADLERLGGRGEIGEATLSEIRALDAGEGQTVPTLVEVLDEFGAEIPFNLEVKRGRDARYPGLGAEVLEELSKRGLRDVTLLSSFEDEVLVALREKCRKARLAVLVSPRAPKRIFDRAVRVGAEAINPHFVMVDEALVECAHRQGLAVYVYTVDDEAMMRRLLGFGVDGLFTNVPDRMRALLKSG